MLPISIIINVVFKIDYWRPDYGFPDLSATNGPLLDLLFRRGKLKTSSAENREPPCGRNNITQMIKESAMANEEQGKKRSQVIVKAWNDDTFKQKLLKDAAAVLKEEGVDIPQGVQVRIVEDTDTVVHFVLPRPPRDQKLNDSQLAHVAGGMQPQPLPPRGNKV